MSAHDAPTTPPPPPSPDGEPLDLEVDDWDIVTATSVQIRRTVRLLADITRVGP